MKSCPLSAFKSTEELEGTFVLLNICLCFSWKSPGRAGPLLHAASPRLSPTSRMPPRPRGHLRGTCCFSTLAHPQATPPSSCGQHALVLGAPRPGLPCRPQSWEEGPGRQPLCPPPASPCPCPGHGHAPIHLAPPPGESFAHSQANPLAGAVLSKACPVRDRGEGAGPRAPGCLSGAQGACTESQHCRLAPGGQRMPPRLVTQNPGSGGPARW